MLSTATASDDVSSSSRNLPVAQVAGSLQQQPSAAHALLRSLRSGTPVPVPLPPATSSVQVPPIPTAEELRLAAAAADERLVGRVSFDGVLLTAAADEAPGVISIPDLMPTPAPPPAPPAPELLPLTVDANQAVEVGRATVADGLASGQPVRRVRTTRRGVTKFFGFDNTVSVVNRRTGTSKTRRRHQWIEFFDPEDERIDVDDYDMPILLVAAQEQEPIEEDANNDADAADQLLKRRLTDIQPTLAYAWGDKDDDVLPEDFHKRMDNGEYLVEVAPRTVLQWAPTNLWYYPLYFEDPGLERYGHTRHKLIQPLVSTGRFFGQVAYLPYQMALHPPKCPEYALGYYQPGEWAPKKKYQVPFNEEAAATQALWLAALILLIP